MSTLQLYGKFSANIMGGEASGEVTGCQLTGVTCSGNV